MFQQVVAVVSSLWPLNKYDFIIVVVRVTCCKLPPFQCHLSFSLSAQVTVICSPKICVCSLNSRVAERMNAAWQQVLSDVITSQPRPALKYAAKKRNAQDKRKEKPTDKKHLQPLGQLWVALASGLRSINVNIIRGLGESRRSCGFLACQTCLCRWALMPV